MPRVPYVPADVREPADLVARIRARRGGSLLNLDRMVLHSPPLASRFGTFIAAVRGELALDAKLRELATCAVALLNGSAYNLHHHAPAFLRSGGTEAQLAALGRGHGTDDGGGAFDETERAVLALTQEMTRSVSVRDATFMAVLDRLGQRGTVELVAVISAYNMVSRFIVALGIEPE
jgi:AhpD family alkylhydroperoxidase